MRKLVSIIIAAVMLISCCASVSAESIGLFKGIGASQELVAKAGSDYVRRDELASVMASLMGLTVSGPAASSFTDVTGDNLYGAAIVAVKNAGILNGVSETEFAPGNTISVQNAIVAMIRVLGYKPLAEAKGGYPHGYIQVASALDLFDAVSKPLDSMLTFDDLWAMTDWALATPVAGTQLVEVGGALEEYIAFDDEAETLLEKNFGAHHYVATVDEVIAKTHSVELTITKADKDLPYAAGDTVVAEAPLTVNIVAFDKAPVNVWLNENNELIYISLYRNSEVIYGTVYSVNGDESANASYHTDLITEMMFWDNETEYEASEDGIAFYYNGKPHKGSISLTNEYVRAVVQADEIIAVEAWEFNEGGIVSEINFKRIAYVKGESTEAISDIESFEKKILILDGECRDIKDLKTDTLIDYYISDDKTTLIILGSERKITDVFESAAGTELQIGNLIISAADVVYTKSSEAGYKEGNVSEVLGSSVSAYVDSYGKVRYITGLSVAKKNSFIGYLMNAKKANTLSPLKLYLTNLDDPAFPEQEYTVSSTYAKNLNIEAFNMDTQSAESIYKFKLNGKGEVTLIETLSPYYGYETADGTVSVTKSSQFIQAGDNPYLDVTTVDGKKRIYFNIKEPMLAMYEEEGEFTFAHTSYKDFESKIPVGDVVLTFFGEEMSSDFTLITVSGDISSLTKDGSSKFGVVDSVSTAIDENGEEYRIVTIDGTKYNLSTEKAAGLAKNDFVYYQINSSSLGSSSIIIQNSVNLSGDLFSWNGMEAGDMQFVSGTIEKIDGKRVFFEDGSVYFLRPSGCTYKTYDNGKFGQGSSLDSLTGRKVIYILGKSSQTVQGIFYQK